MKSKTYLLFIVCSALTLGACDNDGSDKDKDDDDATAPVETENALSVFGSQAADADPLAISQQLIDDIESVFGGADGSATDVIAGDTVNTVIERAKAN